MVKDASLLIVDVQNAVDEMEKAGARLATVEGLVLPEPYDALPVTC